MAALSGLAGTCTIPSTGTLYFRSWSLTWDQAAIDITSFGDGTRKKAAGILEWSGSAEATMDDTSIPLLPGSSVAVVLNVDATRKFNGSAIVTGVGPTVAVDGEATATISFEGTDTLTTT